MDNDAVTPPRPNDATDVVGTLDEIISKHPFADSKYIIEQHQRSFVRRLGRIADRLAPAAKLLACLDEATPQARALVLGNMAIRAAIQHALTRLETGTDYGMPLAKCSDLLEVTSAALQRGAGGPLKQTPETRIGCGPHHGTVWHDDPSERELSSAVLFLIDQNYSERPHQPTREQVACVARGAALAELILPCIARSAFHHVNSVVLFEPAGYWKNTASSSEFRLNGSVFLSTKFLSNPWWVAEHLLHEALHQQLYEFRHTHSLFTGEFDREGAPKVHSLWNVPDTNLWDAHRALAAFHVYVNLSLFTVLAERRADELCPDYGPMKLTSSAKCHHRARYLSEQLSTTCRDELGPAGKRFLTYFTGMLDCVDSAPLVRGSTVHLLLDRYKKEARQVDGALSRGPVVCEQLRDTLSQLESSEIETARGVLRAMNAIEQLDELDQALTNLMQRGAPQRFSDVRHRVADALLSSAREKFRLDPPECDDAVVRMVEDSSQRLKTALSR